jgi:drug/metabolite transporter (DMT)-like permease
MAWLLYALGAAIIWGFNYAVSGRLLERGMTPPTLFFIDVVFATVAMGLFISVSGRWSATAAELHSARPELLWLAMAVVASSSAGVLIFLSIEAKNATLSSLIEVSYPLFTAFFAWALFRQTTLNAATIFGAFLIFAGVLIVARGNR